MGRVSCFGVCCGCGAVFEFHPNKVPSARVNGRREPICRGCVDRANPEREKRGLPRIEVLPGAYEPGPEEEIDWSDSDDRGVRRDDT